MGFIVYVNHDKNHAMIHYAERWHVRNRKGTAGWSEVLDTYPEAEVYAAQEVPGKTDSRLCLHCQRRSN